MIVSLKFNAYLFFGYTASMSEFVRNSADRHISLPWLDHGVWPPEGRPCRGPPGYDDDPDLSLVIDLAGRANVSRRRLMSSRGEASVHYLTHADSLSGMFLDAARRRWTPVVRCRAVTSATVCPLRPRSGVDNIRQTEMVKLRHQSRPTPKKVKGIYYRHWISTTIPIMLTLSTSNRKLR